MPEQISFMPVPTIKPKNAPKAAFRESDVDLFSTNSSAKKAPSKLPDNIPIGVKNIPANIPIKAPMLADLLPPVIVVSFAGTT